jgi:hypothetical protein
VPKLRQQKFETAIIERNRRRESSAGEALIGIYMAGVSVRSVKAVTQRLWGSLDSPGTVSNPKKKIYERITRWRNRLLEGERGRFPRPGRMQMFKIENSKHPHAVPASYPGSYGYLAYMRFFCASQ